MVIKKKSKKGERFELRMTPELKRRAKRAAVNDYYVEVILNPGTTKIVDAVPFRTGHRYTRMVEILDISV